MCNFTPQQRLNRLLWVKPNDGVLLRCCGRVFYFHVWHASEDGYIMAKDIKEQKDVKLDVKDVEKFMSMVECSVSRI